MRIDGDDKNRNENIVPMVTEDKVYLEKGYQRAAEEGLFLSLRLLLLLLLLFVLLHSSYCYILDVISGF